MTTNKKYVGTVVFDRTRYGFISCPELHDNTFYHYSSCSPQEQIHKGDIVEFEICPGREGKVQASKVRLVRGEEDNV